MSSTVPPIQSAGQDYLRKKRTNPLVTGTSVGPRPPRTAGVPRPVPPEEKIDWGEAASALVPAWAKPSTYGSRPAPTGAEKQATGASEHAAAAATARTAGPEGQPDPTPVTKPTSTGAGPRLNAADRVVNLPGEQGYAIVHARGKDPATQPGGFAHPGARKVDPSGRLTEDARIAAMPERGETTYGPKGATGGHSWTLRTPGRQESAYETARYRQQVRGRQAAEEETIQGAEAKAARSRGLAEDPFSPEKAAVAGAVGEQQARQQPEMRAQSLAMESFLRYQQRAAQIDADPNLSDEEKHAMKRDAEREAWMSIIAVQPSARKPRDEFMGFGATPSVEEPT